MQIGFVAQKVGLSVDAIRFHERNGLLPKAARTQGGFRQFGERELETLAFVRRVQAKLDDVRGKLSNLKKLEQELLSALHSCDRELRKHDAHCPILRDV